MIFDRWRGRRGGADAVDDAAENDAAENDAAENGDDGVVDAGDTDAGDIGADEGAEQSPIAEAGSPIAEAGRDEPGVDFEALDEQEWRDVGPFDLAELDDDALEAPDPMRIDLGSLVVTGFEGMELRLQISEETQQIVSALMIADDSALELAAFAAPRSGGLWSELRSEIIASATEAGGSVSQVSGPYGTELRRLLPVTTPDGDQGYQPSRMWVAQGPRWCLRGVLYGQASVTEGLDGPVAPLLEAFRRVVVRRGDEAMAPGDLLPLQLPEGAQPTAGPTEGTDPSGDAGPSEGAGGAASPAR